MSDQHKGKSEEAGNKTWLMVIAAVVVAAVIGGGIYYYRGGFGGSEPTVAKGDPDVGELMQPGALPDIVIGNADAPVTIVEYASMTCPHCAQFQMVIFPQLKAKYIDTGKAKYMLREFPLDNLAVGAFMLARCAGDDRYYPMVDGLFDTQETWAVTGPEAKEKLLLIARQAGFSKERFDQCLGDKVLFNKIVDTRSRGHDRFAVEFHADVFRQRQADEGRPSAQGFRRHVRRTGRCGAGGHRGSSGQRADAAEQRDRRTECRSVGCRAITAERGDAATERGPAGCGHRDQSAGGCEPFT